MLSLTSVNVTNTCHSETCYNWSVFSLTSVTLTSVTKTYVKLIWPLLFWYLLLCYLSSCQLSIWHLSHLITWKLWHIMQFWYSSMKNCLGDKIWLNETFNCIIATAASLLIHLTIKLPNKSAKLILNA